MYSKGNQVCLEEERKELLSYKQSPLPSSLKCYVTDVSFDENLFTLEVCLTKASDLDDKCLPILHTF